MNERSIIPIRRKEMTMEARIKINGRGGTSTLLFPGDTGSITGGGT